MKKRIIALLLVAVMALGLLVGCGKKKKVENDGILRVGITQLATISSYTENDFTKWIEDQLGFKIEFVYYSSSGSEACQQFALDCTANKIDELPDVMWGMQEMSNYTLGDLGEDGYILDLADYLNEEHFPNFMSALKDVPEKDKKTAMEKGVNPDDGGYYGMPLIALEHVDNVGDMMYINKEWLDKVGKDIPTTTEELYDVLKAFKEGDMNGNGDKNDEIPMLGNSVSGAGLVQYLMNAFIYWDSANIYNVLNGKVYSPIVQDQYRQGLQYIAKLYSEGLIGEMSFNGAPYTDFVNMNTPQDQVAKVGIWTGHPSIYTDANTTILDEYVALPYLKDATGVGGYTVFHQNTIKWCSWIMSHTEESGKTEMAMKFLDLMYTDEAMTRMRFGAKDTYWHEGEEGLNIKGNPTKLYIDDDSAFFGGDSTWGRNGNCIMNDANYTGVEGDKVPGTRAAEVERIMKETWVDVCGSGNPNKPAETAEYLVYSSEDYAIREAKHSRYWSYYSEAVNHFIVGERNINDDADWAAYKTELEKLGQKELEGVAQRAYDRSIGK